MSEIGKRIKAVSPILLLVFNADLLGNAGDAVAEFLLTVVKEYREVISDFHLNEAMRGNYTPFLAKYAAYAPSRLSLLRSDGVLHNTREGARVALTLFPPHSRCDRKAYCR